MTLELRANPLENIHIGAIKNLRKLKKLWVASAVEGWETDTESGSVHVTRLINANNASLGILDDFRGAVLEQFLSHYNVINLIPVLTRWQSFIGCAPFERAALVRGMQCIRNIASWSQ